MFGRNPKRPPEKGDGNILQIQEIFPTFQGEGPLTGTPAVFVRLGGCNLACSFCDTEFEDFSPLNIDEIIGKIDDFAKNEDTEGRRELVVITGGEPLRQPISYLCERLLSKGYKVQIETNGTIYRELPKGVDIVCSPKITYGEYTRPHPKLISNILALKFVISERVEHYNKIPELNTDIPVYLQPMDEYDEAQNRKNLELAVKLVNKGLGKLSLQTHKIAGVP